MDPHERAIEVMTLFESTVIDVRYLRRGEAMATAEGRALVRAVGDGHALVVPPGASGTFEMGARAHDLAARPEWPLVVRARAVVEQGSVAYLVRAGESPPDVVRRARLGVDRAAARSTVASALAHVAVVAAVLAVPSEGKTVSTDLFGRDVRQIPFVIRPPEPAEEPPPDWLREPAPEAEAGKRHAGPSGRMGNPKSKAKNRAYELEGPRNNPDPRIAKRYAEEAARKVIGMLGGAPGSRLHSIFSESETALGDGARTALGNLMGDVTGDAYGLAGFDVIGTERGGGGADRGVIGIGPLSTIGRGGRGEEGVRYGSGVTRIEKHATKTPDPIPGVARVRGPLDRDSVRRVIRAHMNEVRHCYEKELVANPELEGRVEVGFTITGAGDVAASAVTATTLASSAVGLCVAEAVRRWRFPATFPGALVEVSYPFLFRSPGR